MTDTIATFRKYASEHGLDLYQIPEGLGICFNDGSDVFWVLPGEGWHFLNSGSATVDIEIFRELDDRRCARY